MTDAAVRARGFGWRHAGRAKPVLDGIDLEIPHGQKVLLLGASGAGKSTLLAAIAGVLGHGDDGDAEGELHVFGGPADAARGEVGLVLQDPDSQVISARVGDDVAFGAENLGVARDEIWRRVRRCLDLVGLDADLDRSTERLSGGQKQRLALAGVLAMGARIIALDEPTANIDPAGVGDLRDAAVRAADATGATLLVVEHRVDAWVDHVDRIIVVGSGGVIADGRPREVLDRHGADLASAGVWVPGHAPQLPPARPVDPSAPGADVALRGRGLSIGHEADAPVQTGLGVELPAGASTCIVGPNGAGKSTLALTLGGLLAPIAGVVEASESVLAAGPAHGARGSRVRRRLRRGPLVPPTAPHGWSSRQLAARVGSVFQVPEHQFVCSTVKEELELGPRLLGLGDDAAAARAAELMERLRLDHLAPANPFTLSGGEKRRLSVATVLSTRPRVVLLDEPTFGQDRRTFTELAHLLRELADDGAAVASVTHDRLLRASLGDHVVELAAPPHAAEETRP
ncbi:ABC transporter ATP-binding protein [Corynebacterium sp.]|uniref:ABC transporter ATP-binding protein n=1 Tax=Corynebacterium sp. TaxID=1720 RepID=UPI0026DD2C72|nr:ABC transporter ATP-binding protein [Corynebacterium sp.]MDO4610372.1 ABC transporter ATP-binding protein [Corynebacterium sp.]